MGTAAAFVAFTQEKSGACGEAGAVTGPTTNTIARKIRMLREHGQSRKYHHEIEGYNGRLDTIQAGILDTKLKHLAESERKAAQAGKQLFTLLLDGAPEMVLPYEPEWSKAVYHLYVVRVADAKPCCRQSWPPANRHRHSLSDSAALAKAYRRLGYSLGDFPVGD